MSELLGNGGGMFGTLNVSDPSPFPYKVPITLYNSDVSPSLEYEYPSHSFALDGVLTPVHRYTEPIGNN